MVDSPEQYQKQLHQSWITNANAWTTAVREKHIASREQVTNQAIVQAILDLAPTRVLDVGCGEGWLCRTLAEKGLALTGIDGSPPLIDAAQALGGANFHAIRYEQQL